MSIGISITMRARPIALCSPFTTGVVGNPSPVSCRYHHMARELLWKGPLYQELESLPRKTLPSLEDRRFRLRLASVSNNSRNPMFSIIPLKETPLPKKPKLRRNPMFSNIPMKEVTFTEKPEQRRKCVRLSQAIVFTSQARLHLGPSG